eukprot:2497115-Rhodomonas_salina.1
MNRSPPNGEHGGWVAIGFLCGKVDSSPECVPWAGESSYPPPRLSNPHASQNSQADRRTPVDSLGFYEMMGYDNVQSPLSTLEKEQEDIKRKSRESQRLMKKSDFLQQVNSDGWVPAL